MSKFIRPSVIWSIAILAVVGIAATLVADGPNGLSTVAGGPIAEPLTGDLPTVVRGPMKVTPVAGEALSVLSFDDGTCEGGLGAGVTVTDLVDFDVPTQCIQGGLDIVGVTGRANTGTAISLAYGQAGAAAPAVGLVSIAAMSSPIAGIGACPGSSAFMTSRTVGPSAAVITGTANFFAGVQGNVYMGRDTNSPPAGRIWLNCPTCGMTQYNPTDLAGLGLGGNWMIRVTVEDANCVPVELMEFTIS